MKGERKTKAQLINDLVELRQRLASLEQSEGAPVGEVQSRKGTLQLYKDIVDGIPTGVAILKLEDPADLGSFRFVDFNPIAGEIAGMGVEKLIGTQLRESQPALLETDIPRMYAEAIRTGDMQEIPEIHYGDEELPKAVWSVQALPLEGGYVAVLFDNITERKLDEEALRIQANRLEHLQKISRSILAATSTEEIMQTALEELRTVVPCHRACIEKIDTEAQLAHVLAVNVNGETQFPRGSNIPLEAFGITDALLRGEAEIIEDIDTLDPASLRVGLPRAEGLRSYIRLPLIVEGELFGTLNLGASEPRAFDSEQCDIAREVTDMLSVALQQASLFESAQRRTLELNRSNALITSLGEVAARLQSNLNAERLLASLGDELRKLDLTSVVTLFEPSGQAAYIRYFSIKPSVLSKIEKVVGFSLRAPRLDPSVHPLYSDLKENRQARFVPSLLEVATLALPKLPKRLARQALRLAHASPDTPSIFLPLVTKDRFAGVLTVWGKELREDDVPAFQVLAHQVAIALENAHLFEQVRNGRERLQFLSRRLVNIQESERRHVARELHDEVGQMLTGMRLTLERCRQLPQEEANAKLREAEELTCELISHLREISLNLHPSMLDDLGLVPALIWQFDRFTAQTGVRVDFEHSGLGGRLPSDLETAAFRITQEALTNVARHTGAGEVTVQIDEERSRLSLRIEDKGPGFDPETLRDARRRVGLTGMLERAVALGGRLAIRSSPGEGTRILAELPVYERLERRSSVRVT